MPYVSVGPEGCSNSVPEVLVELQKGQSASGPLATVAELYAYSAGAWFDEGTADAGVLQQLDSRHRSRSVPA
ncbi:hypothetical protein ACQPYH_12890 [Kribbella sp. CA-245084]|uniref:hypothetical protein n=1 Tax=Kribbella sp. CA-245084 TaxID=3239940 RepID=UPI003D92231D